MKIRDSNEFSFNFTSVIDWKAFDYIKSEQCLEITYDEFKHQIVELFKQTQSKQMLVKLEMQDNGCKLIFYEKSRIKSLIFLYLMLESTNNKEIIEEITTNLTQIKDVNVTLRKQLEKCQNELETKEGRLKEVKAEVLCMETNFAKGLKKVEHFFMLEACGIEKKIAEQLQKMQLRHLKLICDIERVRNENKIKSNSSTRLLHNLQTLRLENEKKNEMIKNLNLELDKYNMQRGRYEHEVQNLKHRLATADETVVGLKNEVSGLKKEIQEAAIIIQQKNKTHDEIAKDLVQANTMLVNFNHQYDKASRDLEAVKDALKIKDELLQRKVHELKSVTIEFNKYREEYKEDEFKRTKHELFLAKQRVEELEKQNKEAVKCNQNFLSKSSDFSKFFIVF